MLLAVAWAELLDDERFAESRCLCDSRVVCLALSSHA